MTTALGDRIRELRKKKGYTLEQLAEAAGSSKSYIWELENKTPPRPSGEKLALLADALDVTTDYLLGMESDEQTAEDRAFFRKYRNMGEAEKAKLRQMLDIIKKK